MSIIHSSVFSIAHSYSCFAQLMERVPHFTMYVKTQLMRDLTRNPAIAEGPRDAGVPVEIW